MKVIEMLIPLKRDDGKDQPARPGIKRKLETIDELTVHYIGPYLQAPETPRQWWLTGPEGKGIQASSHYIIGRDGKTIQCIPIDEVAWTNSDKSNYTSVTFEICPDSTNGRFSEESIESLKYLIAKFIKEIPSIKYIRRHYDHNKKQCPAYYVPRIDDETGEGRWQKLAKYLVEGTRLEGIF